MAEYVRLHGRNEAGEYLKEIKHSAGTFYLVEYRTTPTYYKIRAKTFDDAVEQIDDGSAIGYDGDSIDAHIESASGYESPYIKRVPFHSTVCNFTKYPDTWKN